MANNNDDKQSESASSETGKIKLSIRTARIQKYISVDDDIKVEDVSSDVDGLSYVFIIL